MINNSCYFSKYEDDKLSDLNSSVQDYPLISLNESFGLFSQVGEDSENSINNQLSYNLDNIEIPDKIIPKEKKSIGTYTNANTSLLIFTFEKIKEILNEISFNEYNIIIDNSIEAPEIKKIE